MSDAYRGDPEVREINEQKTVLKVLEDADTPLTATQIADRSGELEKPEHHVKGGVHFTFVHKSRVGRALHGVSGIVRKNNRYSKRK